jgi:DNA-binding PadR family transcriptional regulator
MPIHHAVLSLLSRGESYGYELKGEFARAVGPQWGTLNIGHVYQVLDRLRRDGLVTVLRSEPQPRGSDRLIYAITPAGRAELARWLETPSAPAAGYRDDLYLKLLSAAAEGEETLRAVIRRERAALLGELHALRSLPAADELASLLAEGAALQVDARVRLLDLAEDAAAALAAAGARAATPTARAQRSA